MKTHRAIVVAALGTTQTIAWASSYYMPAILGAPIADALHLPTSVFFGLFSGALLLSAVVGPSVGRLIDRHGGRVLLASSNLVIAAGLVILAAAHGIAGLVIAWTVLGVGIGMGLYDPAFAALTWLYGREARSSITGITLIAGFASTIGWPMSAVFLHEFGWRAACLIWAGTEPTARCPVKLAVDPAPWHARPGCRRPRRNCRRPSRRVRRCQSWPSSSPPLGSCRERWRRICRVCCRRRVHPRPRQSPLRRWSVRLRSAPASSSSGYCARSTRSSRHGSLRCCIRSAPRSSCLFGVPGIVAFALLHGAGNGMITIAKGTLPLALFGPHGYGLRSGLLSAPARMLQSAAPFLFGLLLDRVGIGAVGLSAGLCLAAFGSLFLLHPHRAVAAQSSPAGG